MKKVFFILSALSFLYVPYLLVYGDNGYLDYLKNSKLHLKLQKEITQEKTQINRIQAEIDNFTHSDLVKELKIREILGYRKKNELTFFCKEKQCDVYK